MNIEYFREYCLQKPGVTEAFPFDEEVLVFKVGGKIFALAGISEFDSINLKCDPEYAIELRERYSGIAPGYHMNKKHWNTVSIKDSLPEELIRKLIDHSYQLVLQSLPKSAQAKLN